MILTFLSITDGDIATMTSYTTDFLGDLTPLLLPVVAIGVGLIIFVAIVRAIRGN